MYRFWSSGSRGCDKTADATHLDLDCAKPIAPGATDITVPSPKRSRPVSVDTQCAHAPSKRVKTEHVGELLSPVSVADGDDATVSRKPSGAVDLERAREAIQYQFGLEILLKHDELRLIDQELAKCQVALEQLRRCHLMPYPTHCPTPSQMLEISSGKGPVLQAKPGQPVPKWAPPFGVVEGPYARHYAKWLIPDPAFDGIQPQARVPTEATRSRNVQVEGRTTRNSMPDVGAVGKPRSGRGAGQRLQALSSGYPQPKDKQAPCVLKRSDGATVKLVCIDCHRWDFSSTQGFINHCRIAHRRDFKSHEEAAVHCGHPIEVDETGGIVGDDSKPAAAAAAVAPASAAPIPAGLVHPLVRDQDMTEQHAYKALASRIRASLVLYHAGKLPGVGEIPTAPAAAPSKLVESSETPFLAQLMRKKNRGGNLDERVEDAKTKIDWDAAYQTEDDDREPTPSEETLDHSLSAARTPAGVMRVPARSGVAPPRQEPSTAPPISNSRFPTDASQLDFSDLPLFDVDDDDMMDVDLSPNTITSNNAPSLVSDSSDEAESSSSDDAASEDDDDNESVSDVAEIKVDEDHEAVMHRRSSSSGTGKKDEPKHVTFVGPLSSGGGGKGRRKQTATQKMRVA